jgi:hypothetical protein
MKAVLTLWAERSWESCRQRALGRPVIARSLVANDILRASEKCCSVESHQISLCARPSVVCLGAAIFFLALPGGAALRPGLVPAGWGGTRAMPSGEVWGGGGGLAAGALIGLLALGAWRVLAQKNKKRPPHLGVESSKYI